MSTLQRLLPDRGRTGPRPGAHLERAFAAKFLSASGPLGNAEQIVRQRWPSDEVAPAIITRATATTATTTSSAWAGVLATQAIPDFFVSLAPISAAAKLMEAGTVLGLDGVHTIALPRRVGGPLADVPFVPEHGPIPVRQYNLANIQLGPAKKLATDVVLTNEVLQRTAGEEVIRLALREDAALSLDSGLFSTAAASTSRPAGLLNGLVDLGATAGGGFEAMIADLTKIAGAVASGGGGDLVFVMHPEQAFRLLLHEPDFRYPVWSTTGVATGTLIGLDPRGFVSGFGPEPRFDRSPAATLHMDTIALNFSEPDGADAGTEPDLAVPLRSLWQTNSVALRLLTEVAWATRGPVAFLTGATW